MAIISKLPFFCLILILPLFSLDNKPDFPQTKIRPRLHTRALNPAALPSLKMTAERKKELLSFMRRSEIVFFIALPFTIWYNKQIMNMIHSRGQVSIFSDKSSFIDYERLYIVANSLLWAGSVSFNSLYENLSDQAPEEFTRKINSFRITLNILRRHF